MSEPIRFDGRTVIVTGAGRGIGRAHALAFAERGAHVLVNDRGTDRDGRSSSGRPATVVTEEILDAGGSAYADFNDVTDPASAAELVQTALSVFGGLHIVVNNAGTYDDGTPLRETTLDHFEWYWRAHVGGTVNVTRAAWPHLRAQHYGRVINTGSCSGLYGQPGALAYSSAKAAVHGLSAALALEGPQHGIQVNEVAPTALTRMTGGLDHQPEQPVDKVLRPEYVSPVVLWLAHDSCPVNGHIYEAGAGRVARVRIGETRGAWDNAPTPESVAASLAQIDDAGDMYYPTDAVTYADWLVAEHRTRF